MDSSCEDTWTALSFQPSQYRAENEKKKKKKGLFFFFFFFFLCGKGGGKTKEIKIIEKKIRTTNRKNKKDIKNSFFKAHNDERTRVNVYSLIGHTTGVGLWLCGGRAIGRQASLLVCYTHTRIECSRSSSLRGEWVVLLSASTICFNRQQQQQQQQQQLRSSSQCCCTSRVSVLFAIYFFPAEWLE